MRKWSCTPPTRSTRQPHAINGGVAKLAEQISCLEVWQTQHVYREAGKFVVVEITSVSALVCKVIRQPRQIPVPVLPTTTPKASRKHPLAKGLGIECRLHNFVASTILSTSSLKALCRCVVLGLACGHIHLFKPMQGHLPIKTGLELPTRFKVVSSAFQTSSRRSIHHTRQVG